MFETGGLELIALIAVVALVIAGVAIVIIANVRKTRKLIELEKSGDFSAVYDNPFADRPDDDDPFDSVVNS